MNRPRPKEREFKPPVPVGRCGVSACAAECLATCKTCCDTLWVAGPSIVGDNRPLIEHLRDGSLKRCPDCEFATRQDESLRARQSALAAAGFHNGREPIGTIRDYNPLMQQGRGREQCRAALQATRGWALGEGPHLLVLSGNTGVGKTHLAEGVTEYLVFTRRKHPVMVSGEKFVQELALYLSANQENRQAFEKRLTDADYLVLDEVGIGYGKGGEQSEFVSSIYQRIIGARFADGLPTMVTGNLRGDAALKEILGDRVVSRLQDTRFAKVLTMWDAADIRPQMGKKR